ncbi:MAG TPA: serine hydrolase domain-containing protein [Xanthobacteraceae bacterium]|nr:serine hydrolase domain-containing protein [Xanthobacteraceae bacterium]
MRSIDAAIDQALAEQRIVGAVVLVWQDGKEIYRRAAGLADRERNVAMREGAVFRLASLTKPIVTAAALRMVELGSISLDDPVTRYLPSFRPALPDGEVPTITLRQLMTHTAGLGYGFMQPPDGSYHRAGVSDGLDQPGLAMADELARITRAGLAYRPGERWAYSVAMDVLGAVLEAVEARDLEAIVAEHVTAPLRLASMGFDLKPGQPEALAACYADGAVAPVRIPDEGFRVHFPEGLPLYAGLGGVSLTPARVFAQSSFRSAGGGMIGSASDMLTFVEALRAGGAPILSADTVDAMMTVQTGTLPIVNRGPGWGFGFGGALLVDPAAAQTPQSRGTFGWGGVWGHAWFVDPAQRLSVVSLSNTALEGMMGRYVRDLRDAIYAELR